MATYYINPDATAGGSGSASSPYTNFSSVGSLSAGDSVLFKRGTTHSGSVVIAYSGTQNNRITFGAYYNADGTDDTTKTRPIIVCGTTSQNAILFNNQGGLLIKDLQVTAPVTSDLGNGIGGYAQSAGTGTYITIRNCRAFNCKGVGIGMVTPYNIGAALSRTMGNIIEDCTSDTTGSIGIAGHGGRATDGIIRRSRVTNACTTADFGGLYCGQIKATLASGGSTFTTNVAGNVWSRTFTKAQINSGLTGTLDRISGISIANDSFSSFGSMLTLNNSVAFAALSPGEYGYSGADPITVAVNLGVAPGSYPLMYVYPDLGFVTVEDCEVSYTQYRTSECMALYIDDAMQAVVKRNWVHHNENRGIMIHRGTGCLIYGNIIEDNTSYGIAVTGGMNTKIYNNIIRRNTGNGIQIATVATLNECKNNIIQSNAIGISGLADTVASNNCFYGNSSTVSGFASAGGDVTTEPQLDANGSPVVGGNLAGVGAHVGGYRRDFEGGQFWNPPSIGAYEYVRAKGLRT